jgi:hypothetical protein
MSNQRKPRTGTVSVDPRLFDYLQSEVVSRDVTKISGKRIISPTTSLITKKEHDEEIAVLLVAFARRIEAIPQEEIKQCYTERRSKDTGLVKIDINYLKLAHVFNKHMYVDIKLEELKERLEEEIVRIIEDRVAARINRMAAENQKPDKNREVREMVDSLFDRLQANHERLLELGETKEQRRLRREFSFETLSLLRNVVSLLLPASYAEGTHDVDLNKARNTLLEYSKNLSAPEDELNSETLESDLVNLHKVMSRYDGSIVELMQIAQYASRVVIDLSGKDSYLGLFSQLNVLVLLKTFMTAEDYADQMSRIATSAQLLRQDPAKDKETSSMINWIDKKPAKKRLPRPHRLMSYCLGNEIFRLASASLESGSKYLERIEGSINKVREKDSSFEQLSWYEVLYGALRAHFNDDPEALRMVCQRLQGDGVTKVLASIQVHYGDYGALINMIEEALKKYVPPRP